MECLAVETWLRGLTRVAFGAFTCVLAVVGAIVGMVTGAIAGHTTETGLVRGILIGAIAGAVVSMDVLDSFCNGESLSKIAIFSSLINGKIFQECVCPAVLKAYQWQVNTVQNEDLEMTSQDIFDIANNEGITWKSVEKLPELSVGSSMVNTLGDVSCSVCLQDFEEGERARRLPICCHLFHSCCIDPWLIRNGTCPMCRSNVEFGSPL